MPSVTEDEVRPLIHARGRLQDDHAGLSAFLPIIAEEGFELRFGDNLWLGDAGLEGHQELKRRFFDETHIYQWIDVRTSEEQAEATSVMQWGRASASRRRRAAHGSRRSCTIPG
jgi:hypothetical protein